MSYAYSTSARRLSRRGIAVAVVASLAVPFYGAYAQLGGLVKKAKNRVVEQQVANQVEKRVNPVGSDPGAAPKFDDVTLELTNDRIGQIIRGLSAGRAVLDGANGSPSRATLIAQRDDAAHQSADLSQKNTKAFDAYNEKRDASQRCRNDAIHASREKRQQANDQRAKEFQAKAMSDPAFREKAMAVAQKMAVAQQKGDTAEVRRLMIELNSGAPAMAFASVRYGDWAATQGHDSIRTVKTSSFGQRGCLERRCTKAATGPGTTSRETSRPSTARRSAS